MNANQTIYPSSKQDSAVTVAASRTESKNATMVTDREYSSSLASTALLLLQDIGLFTCCVHIIRRTSNVIVKDSSL